MVEICVPKRSSRPHKKFPWENERIGRLKRVKQKKWRKYNRHKNIVKRFAYKQASDNLKAEFIKAKQRFESNLLMNKNNSTEFFRYMRRNIAPKIEVPCLKATDGTCATTDAKKCEMFSDHFSSVYTNDDGTLPVFDHPNLNSILRSFVCTPFDVIWSISQLKPNSAPGPDGFTNFFLKNIKATIAAPLCKIFTVSLDSGELPHSWKIACVKTTFQKRGPSNSWQL